MGHNPQETPGLGGLFHHVMAEHGDLAFAGFGQTGQDADEGGFARTVGAQEAKKLALLNVKTHPLQGLKGAPRGDIGFADLLE